MPSHGAGGGGAGGGAGGEAVGQQFSFTLRGEIRVVSVPPHAGDYTVRLRATHTVNLRHSEVTLFVRVLPSTNTLYRFSPSTLSFTDNTTLTLTPPANPADAVTFNLLTDASPFLIADARTLTPKATTLAGRYVIPVRAVVRRSDHSSVSVYADLTATISPALRPNVSPRLPSSTVYVSAAERSPSGTYAGRLIAYARQQDTVAFYAGNCAQLAVDRSTGVLTTRVRFDRSKHETHVICNFTATAESRGRLYRQYAGLRVYVQPDVNLQPRFAFTGDKDDSSGGYMFNAGVGRQGEVVGRVHIVSAHPVATPEYRLFPADVASPEFAINSTSGVITRLTARQGTRRRRSVAEVDGTMSLYSSSKHSRSRNKRSTIADVILHVIARVGNRETGVQVLIRASSPPPHPNGSSTQMPSSAGKGFSGTPMVLLIVLVCVGIVAAAVVVAVVVLRRRDRRRRKPRALADISTCHDNRGLDVSSTALPHLHADPKPHYTPNTTGGGGKGKGHNLHQPPIELPPYRQTLPEIPPESSGRGSAVDYDGDEVS